MVVILQKWHCITSPTFLPPVAKLVPVGYGIKKLQITCVVEDDKIGTDFLEESITAHKELVRECMAPCSLSENTPPQACTISVLSRSRKLYHGCEI